MFGSATRIVALAFVLGLALVAVAEDGLAVEKGSRLTRRPIFTEVAIPTASAWAPTDTAAVGLRELDCSLGARRSCGPSDCPCCYTYRDWWENCAWSGHVGVGVAFPGLTGALGTTQDDFPIDTDPASDWQLHINAGVSKGPWSLQAMVSGMEFDVRGAQNAAPVNITTTLYQWQVNLYYRAIVAPLTANSNCSSLIVWEPYIGVRGNNAELSGTDVRFRRVDSSKNWVDAVIGLRATWDLRNNWAFDVEGDVGGGMSNITWKCRLGVNWRFCSRWYVGAGWLWLDTDFEDGSGADYFRWDVLQTGPYVALTFAF